MPDFIRAMDVVAARARRESLLALQRLSGLSGLPSAKPAALRSADVDRHRCRRHGGLHHLPGALAPTYDIPAPTRQERALRARNVEISTTSDVL